MSTTLSISETSPPVVGADAVVVAVLKGTDGPLPGPGAKHVDEALGGTLAATLAALGVTGEVGEVTKIATG
ncbi:MAG TPA: leucyl aminopeptidase, partial [Streptosporangiaceae bacterium]